MSLKALFIGGTGVISSDVSALAVSRGIELYLLNRGKNPGAAPSGAKLITADINDENDVRGKLAGMSFDVVCDFIVFNTEQARRDYRLFSGIAGQYVFISSASAYSKPVRDPVITESTPLNNPFWDYSENKRLCEEFFMEKYRSEGFPVTIIRPSHTYNRTKLPMALHGKKGFYQVLDRMMKGKKVIVHGDGTSLWTVTHSSDFAKAFVGLMGNRRAIGEAFHITSDEALPWNTIYEIIGGALGVKPDVTHIPTDILTAAAPGYIGPMYGDKSNPVIFDNSKVKRLVPDFIVTTPFSVGAKLSVDYILSHPECRTPDPEFDAWCDEMTGAFEKLKTSLPFYDI